MKPIISIIIPTKNEEKNIRTCLASIQKQTFPKNKMEIIVVDNFSNDRTRKIAERMAHVIQAGNERSQQRNIGAKKARGTYLLFLDADMELGEYTVTEVIQLLKKKKRMVSMPQIGKGNTFWEKVMALESRCYYKEYDIHAARGFRKKFFLDVGGYDEAMYAGEDWDLTLRCKGRHATLVATASPIIHHESIGNIFSHLKKEDYYIQNIHCFAQKHPQEFAKLASFRYRGWLFIKNIHHFIHDPLHAAGLIGYKLFVHIWSRPQWRKQ